MKHPEIGNVKCYNNEEPGYQESRSSGFWELAGIDEEKLKKSKMNRGNQKIQERRHSALTIKRRDFQKLKLALNTPQIARTIKN